MSMFDLIPNREHVEINLLLENMSPKPLSLMPAQCYKSRPNLKKMFFFNNFDSHKKIIIRMNYMVEKKNVWHKMNIAL